MPLGSSTGVQSLNVLKQNTGAGKVKTNNGRTVEDVIDASKASASVERYSVSPESGVPVVNVNTGLASAISDSDSNGYELKANKGSYLCDGLDFSDFNLGKFKGNGADSTQFYADSDVVAGPFADLGWNASDTVHPSSIQFAEVGGFSVRSNGNLLNYGCSFDNYRRGWAENIRLHGSASADELENGFKLNYSWVANFNKLMVSDHYGNGFEFGTSSLNAVTCMNFSGASARTTAKNYLFNGSNSVVLISPNSEGDVLQGWDFSSNVRSVTIINPHIEGANSGFLKSGADNNGCSINIVGGACFTSPECLDFSGPLTDLNIQGFCMYNLSDLADLDIQINARTAVINNLTVLDASKNRATEKQIIEAITLGSNCERCIVNGVDIVKLYRREEFDITINPGTPQILQSKYIDSMHRRMCTVMVAQRTGSSLIGHIYSSVTVTEDDTIDVDNITSRNATTGLVIGFDTASDMLTVDGSIAGNAKVVIEYFRP